MADAAAPRWPTDVTLFCLRLAGRLAAEGYEHPLAAALALAVRGRHGVTTEAMAVELGLDPSRLAAIEAGEVAVDDLPPALVRAIDAVDGLERARLRPA